MAAESIKLTDALKRIYVHSMQIALSIASTQTRLLRNHDVHYWRTATLEPSEQEPHPNEEGVFCLYFEAPQIRRTNNYIVFKLKTESAH